MNTTVYYNHKTNQMTCSHCHVAVEVVGNNVSCPSCFTLTKGHEAWAAFNAYVVSVKLAKLEGAEVLSSIDSLRKSIAEAEENARKATEQFIADLQAFRASVYVSKPARRFLGIF